MFSEIFVAKDIARMCRLNDNDPMEFLWPGKQFKYEKL